MTDRWVVNASPGIVLARAGHLHLLEALCSELIVPEAVAQEILAGPDDPGRQAIAAGLGRRAQTVIPGAVSEWGLGRGESAVLALALELEAAAVLDDRNARRAAKTFGVSMTGALGLVARALRRAALNALPPPCHAPAWMIFGSSYGLQTHRPASWRSLRKR